MGTFEEMAPKKAPAKKTTAKKAPAKKKTPAKKPAKKTTAKKAPAKKKAHIVKTCDNKTITLSGTPNKPAFLNATAHPWETSPSIEASVCSVLCRVRAIYRRGPPLLLLSKRKCT